MIIMPKKYNWDLLLEKSWKFTKILFALIVFGAMIFGLGLWFFSIGLLGELLIKASVIPEKKIHTIFSNKNK